MKSCEIRTGCAASSMWQGLPTSGGVYRSSQTLNSGVPTCICTHTSCTQQLSLNPGAIFILDAPPPHFPHPCITAPKGDPGCGCSLAQEVAPTPGPLPRASGHMEKRKNQPPHDSKPSAQDRSGIHSIMVWGGCHSTIPLFYSNFPGS